MLIFNLKLMKKYIYQILCLTVVMISLNGCKKDFLNVVPKGKLVAKSTSDYDLIMNSPYFYQTPNQVGGPQQESQMGDDIAAEAVYYNVSSAITQKNFRWEDEIYAQSDRVVDLTNQLANIYIFNKVINEVMSSDGGTEQQKRSILAEAQASRSFLYFQFINAYGKPYTTTAAADLGFPIIKSADVTAKSFQRNTVQEVYDFIISDLTSAIQDLPIQNKFATRFSKGAAEALLGKVYLFMGRNADALRLFDAAFIHNAAQSTPAKLYNYNTEFAAGGKFLPILSTGPSNSPGFNQTDYTEALLSRICYYGPGSFNDFNTDFVVLSPTASALFDSSDLRLNFYGPYFPYEEPNPSGRLAKYASQYIRYGIELPDLILLRAEAKARTGDLAGAVADVETLRSNRMPLAAAAVPAIALADQKSLLSFIIDERVREFATQGYRWYDMRRLSVDPLFSGKTYTHILYNDTSAANITVYTLRPQRLTKRLPASFMIANPNFVNNP